MISLKMQEIVLKSYRKLKNILGGSIYDLATPPTLKYAPRSLQCDENIQTKPPFKLPFIKIKFQRVRAHSYTRVGLFDLPDEEIRSMTAYHRYHLGRYWRLRLTCQHPSHSKPLRRCTGRDVFN